MAIEFWKDEMRPTQLLGQLLENVKSDATLWDIFERYEPLPVEGESGNDIQQLDGDFLYARLTLVYSDTFFGFDDSGHLSYEEQEARANQKFEEYTVEISGLLQLQPDSALMPKPLDCEKLDRENGWDAYDDFFETYSLAHELEGPLSAWQCDNKVLFLTMGKEDKELPYELSLCGLSFKHYRRVLEKYNQLL